MKRALFCSAVLFCVSTCGFAQSASPTKPGQRTDAQPAGGTTLTSAPNTPRAPFLSLPLSFEKNTGQSDARVKFLSRGPGYNLLLTADQAVFAFPQGTAGACAKKGNTKPCTQAEATAPLKASVLRLRMLGAAASAGISGIDQLPGNTSYFIGNDPRKWHVNVPNFEKVKYSDIYPGIDLIYYGNQQQLESDFVLAPGADPRKIQFEVNGANRTRLDAQGNLVFTTEAGEVRLLRPGIYQMVKGSRVEIAGHYVLLAENRVGFEVSPYDTTKPLVIDPTLVYATFLGGSSLSGDLGNAVTVDASGNAYVTGQTTSADFPGTVLFPASEGSFFFYNTFVSKFNPAGTQLLYSVLIGGQSFDSGEGGSGIGVDGSGNAYITGITDATNFPTVNPFQAVFGGGFETAYVVKIASDGASLVYSTFFGGRNSSDTTNGNGIFVDTTGNAYVVGNTTSANFPTVSPMQATLNGFENAFIGKFNPTGQVIYSSYLGGNGSDVGMAITVDSNQRAYVTGKTTSSNFPAFPVSTAYTPVQPGFTNAFVSRFSADGSSLEYSTYLGGSNGDSAGGDVGMGIAVDSTFNAYVTGQTDSTNFPRVNPIQNTFTSGSGISHAFVTKFNPTGTAPVYSTLLGGEKSDFATGIALDSSNNAYVAGATKSTTFPLVKPMQGALAGAQNAFITRVNTGGTAFDYSTYLGGNGTDVANGVAVVASTGNAYVVGTTTSVNFPVLGALQASLLNSVGNVFVAEISPATPSTITLFPPAFSFGQIGIGQTSFSEPVTLSNFTGASVTINTISLAGTNPGDFAQTNTCGTLPAALANGATCIISVTFSPSVQDLRSAILSVSDTGAGSPHTMAVSGIGTVPEVSLSKTSIAFGNGPLNYPTSNSVQITNTGGVPLHISSLQFSGTNASEFTSQSCVTTLAPGGTCFISVTFIPTAAGARSASLLINDDAAGSPQILPLTGTGVAEVIVLPTSINYGPQIVGVASFAEDFTFINGSGVVVTLATPGPAIVEGGTNPGDFPITAGAPTTCTNGLVLPLGGTCIVEAKFLPTAAGARSATIAFNYTGFAGPLPSPITVNLAGVGLQGVSVSTNPVNFGSEYVGFTASTSDQLYNATASPITVSSIVIGGTNPTDFTITLSPSCAPAGVVSANSSCSMPMTFTPTALGARSATATINFTGATGSPIVVNLNGTGIPGPVTLNKFSMAYGGQIIGLTSLPQRVIFTNLSTADVGSVNISTGSTLFTVASSSTCGVTLKAGTSCAIDVVFAPTATGAATATLTVTDNDPGSPRTIALSGVGEPSVVSVSTTTLDFGNQTVGKASASRAVFLINAGASQITITTPGSLAGTNASEFAIVNGASTTCTNGAHVIGSGGTCSIAVTFTPAASGARTATLSFAASTGGTQTITLTGNGVLTPTISLSSTFVFFSNTQPTGTTSAAQIVTVTNTGNGPLTLTSISLGGTNAADFTTAGSTCAVNTPIPPALGPGNTCTFSIALAPVETGSLFATLSITSNSGNNPNTSSSISMDGNAAAGGVVVSPASFDFGAVAVNSASNAENFTITNNTATPMVTGTFTFTGANAGDFSFPFGAPSCGTIAAFGGECTFVDVAFTPKAAGARSGQMTIPFTGPTGSPITVNLTGTGSTILAFSPNPVVFPSTTVGSSSFITATLSNGTASNVTLTNTPVITGTNAADFTNQFPNCTSGTVLLASGGSTCQVQIGFAPTARGSRTAQLVYTLSAGGPLTLTLNGSATGPVMTLSPSPLNFTVAQTVNTQSPSQFLTVSNTGDSTLFLSSETLTGANGNDFSFPTYNSCYSLNPGTSCQIAVAFTPFAVGARTGLLTVVPQTPLASQSVVLNGTGQAGTVTVSPTSLTYSSQNVGTTSGSQAVLLRNTSNAQVTLSTVALSGANPGDFPIAAGTTCTAGAKIPALSGTCIVNITFSPTAISNPRTATLTITDGTFGAHPVTLSGTGANPIVSVPTSLTFATSQLVGTTSAAQGVTLSNFTTSAVTISGTPAISGTNVGDFAIGTNTCTSGANIPATTGTCTVNITFHPTAAGSRTATLTITDAVDALSPHTVTLSGTGIQPIASLGSGGAIAFGNVNLGSTSAQQSVTLTNSGTATLNISSVSAPGGTNPGDFALVTPSIGSDCRTVGSLAPSASCSVAATFTPAAAGARSATVTITDDASPTTQTVNLTGTGTQPGVGLVPTSIPFGNQRLSTTSAKSSSVLTNTGTGSLTITGVTLAGTNPGDFALTTPASGSDCRTVGTVAAGASCTIAATFTPTALGSRAATVSLADSASGSPQSLPLTGTGTFPQATPAPSPVAFGNQRQNVASTVQTLTLTNGGTDTLNLTTVALGGTNANQFAIATGTTCTNGSTVLAGANCVVKLTFTPTTLGAQAATVTFTDDANPTTQVVNLTGTGVFPQASAPSPLPFGNQRLNVASVAATLTLTNGGTDTLHITTVAIGGTNASEFTTATGTTCVNAGTVAAGATCVVKLIFTPTALGAQAATVTFTDDASPTTQVVNLTGTGVFPQAAPAPATIPFGNQTNGTTSAPQTVTLNNAGTDTLHITTVALGGTNPTAFAIAAGTTCVNAGTVAPGASCIVNLTFTPSGLSAFAATLTFTDDATPTTQAVNLTGTGVTSTVNFAPTTVPFGNQRQGTTSAQMTSVLSNNGSTTLTISGITLGGANPGDFAFATPTGGNDCRTIGTVAAGATCNIAATFTPTATGSRSATVSVADSAAGSPHTLPLTGTGTFPQATPTPSPVAFGNQRQNVASSVQALTLTNGGNDTLHLTTVALGGANANQFAIATGTTCVNGGTVAAGANCVVNLTFTPTVLGAQAATVTFTDDASPTTQVVNVTGTGVFPQASAPSPLPFGNQRLNVASAAATLTLTNGGTDTLHITTVAIGGTNASEFTTAAGTTCVNAGTVAAGSTCVMKLIFTPTALGAQAATVTFTDDASPTTQVVNLTGTGVFPQASPAPATVPFGNQANGTTSAPQTVTLNNAGTDTLHITTVALGGTNPAAFAIAAGTTCVNAGTVAPGASCIVNLTFTPSGLSAFAATLTFTDDATPTTQTVNLTGTGVTSTVNFNPTTVPFGNQRQGTTSAQMTSVLSNNGSTTLTISGVTLTGTNPGDFAFATPAGGSDCRTIGTVAAGASCNIAATFTPTALGARSATVSVADSASGSPHTFSLTGTGTFPQATPTPSPVAFGNQRQNVASTVQALTLTNGGTDTLHLTTVALGGTNANQFAIATGTTCVNGGTVAAGANCVVNLTFTPTTLGAKAAMVTFTDDASPTTQVVNLTGTGVFPQASAPSPLPFGNQRLNVASAAVTLTLTNGGTDTLHITTVAIGGTNASEFTTATGTTCVNAGTVAAGSTCVVKLIFTPTTLGAQAATVTFTDDASPTTQVVNLTGTGVFPQAAPAPATIPFGNQTNGTTSAPQTVTLNNAGTDTLHITTVALGGTNPTAFAIAAGTTCVNAGTVAPGSSCIVNLTFTPSGLSAFAATLTFTDDATPTTQAVNLTGTGVTSTVNFNPTTIPFANQRQGATSAQQTSVLTNSGATALTISGITLTGTNPGDFAFATPASGSDCRTIGSVAAAATCMIAVTFTPAATGSRTATVSVADNATGSPHTLTLTGTGIAPAVSLSASSVPFANQIIATTSAPQSVTLTNTGTDVLHLTTVVLGGTNPADFAIASGTTCNNGATVAAGSTCVLNLTFTPVAATPFAATITITDDAIPATQTVNLSGTGVTPPTATLSAGALNFNTQRVNTTSAAQSVTITNSGGAPLNITSIAIGGTNAADFLLASPATTCPTTTSGQVAPASSCTLSVTFTPAAINARSASITITVTGISSPAPITLSGTGIAPAVTLAPPTVAFGNQPVSTTSAATPGTLTNSGTDDLHITAVAITGTNASDFAIVAAGTNCNTGLPRTVAKTVNCTWSVTFTPTALGARTASLTFTDDSNAVAGQTQSVTLTGTGTAPAVQLAPTTVTFTPQVVNTTSAAQTVTLTNSGSATLHLTTVSIAGTNASDFAVAAGTTCVNGGTVANGATCLVNVTFKPTAIGTRTASLTFTDDAVPGPQTVPLTGTTPPAVSLNPATPIAFNNQGVATASAASLITLTNTGGSTLHITTLAISGTNAGDFAIATTGTTCTNGSTVAALATCAINVTFTPAAVGARGPATLTITDDASPSTTQTVSMTGTGIDFTIGVSTPATPAVAGVPITATIQVTPGSNGFPNAVTFAATNLPPDTTAMFSPASFTPGSTTMTTVLTLTTTKRGSGVPRPTNPTNLPLSGGWIATALLALLGMATLRRGVRMQRFGYLPLAVLLLSAAIITGCATGPTGTPAGSYNVTVTATSGTLSHSTTVAITVQ